MVRRLTLSTALILMTASLGMARVELPSVIGDNAVLQQKTEARLWGWAKPGQTVKITPSWSGETVTAEADMATGRWDATVLTPEASYTAHSITFDDGTDPLAIGNVLIGEVWLCSGQSNMEMPLRGFGIQPVEGAAQAIAYSGDYPGVRVATVPKAIDYEVRERPEGVWKASRPENAGEFSAVGYFFARSLNRLLDVPVGVLVCAYGGSKVEGWLPQEIVDSYADCDMARERADAGFPHDMYRSGVMYNAMLHPLIGYTIRGFLWNQGESNVGRHGDYPERLATMVGVWRDKWGLGELPFYCVEIPGYSYGNPDGNNAALLREAQHKAVEIIPSSGIISAIDLIYPHEIEDIHGSRKEEIGERLAFMAASKNYGIQGIDTLYPQLAGVDYQGPKAVVKFNDPYNGVYPHTDIPGFEVAGEDRIFYPARADENWNDRTITVSAPEVPEVKAVRYCFRNFAIGAVHGMTGLPLVPFRTDGWDDVAGAPSGRR